LKSDLVVRCASLVSCTCWMLASQER
jgi:hypothetical protein